MITPVVIEKWTLFGVSATLLAVALLFGLPPSAEANHIPEAKDVNLRRPPMPLEGYLNFRHAVVQGEERTGWTDIRHPAQATLAGRPAGTDTKIGYDRSDHFINARTTVLTDATPLPGGAPDVAPSGGIPDDFHFANKAWAQAGLSFIETATRGLASPAAGMPGSFTFPIDSAERGTILANNAPGTPQVEVYYTRGIEPGNPLGITRFPSFAAGGRNEAIFMANTGVAANPRRNTLAHELGHFLLDDANTGTGRANAVHVPNPVPDDAHSSDRRNIVANPQWDPGSRKDEIAVGDPPWNIADSIDVIGMAMSTNPDGSPKVGGTNQIEPSQIRTVFSEPDVRGWLNIPNDRGATHGDRADFDWVEDNIKLELAGGAADNHAAIDFMVWEIAATAGSAHNAHMHDAWGELGLPDFGGPFFRTIDVVSQIGRYIDSDVDPGGNLSRREAALDFVGGNAFFPEFSIDAITWLAGELINVFIPGWNPERDVQPEDYVSRWRSPIDAHFVRLAAHAFGADHDGNAQIDAIIATRELVRTIAEPGSLVLLLIAVPAMLAAVRRIGSGNRAASGRAENARRSTSTGFSFTQSYGA